MERGCPIHWLNLRPQRALTTTDCVLIRTLAAHLSRKRHHTETRRHNRRAAVGPSNCLYGNFFAARAVVEAKANRHVAGDLHGNRNRPCSPPLRQRPRNKIVSRATVLVY